MTISSGRRSVPMVSATLSSAVVVGASSPVMSSAATIQAAVATSRASSASRRQHGRDPQHDPQRHQRGGNADKPQLGVKARRDQTDQNEQQPGADQHRERLKLAPDPLGAQIASGDSVDRRPHPAAQCPGGGKHGADQPELQSQSAQQRRRKEIARPAQPFRDGRPLVKALRSRPLFPLPRSAAALQSR